MDPYQKMYTTLFNSITDILNLMDTTPYLTVEQITELLKQAQAQTEAIYIQNGLFEILPLSHRQQPAASLYL